MIVEINTLDRAGTGYANVRFGPAALPPKADMCGALPHVCFGPIADSRARSFEASGHYPVQQEGAPVSPDPSLCIGGHGAEP
jgi:hypothetical protein